jgi:hypothetical protein
MPAKIHPRVRARAKELWEKEGYSPKEILQSLSVELIDGTLRVPGVKNISDVAIPTHRSTINDWANEDGWNPHWREARKQRNQQIQQDIAEGKPFPISGIKDPIWHLAILEAQRYVADLKPPPPPFLAFLLRKGYSLEQIEEAFLTNQELDWTVDDDSDGNRTFQTFLHSDNYDLGNSDEELIAATQAHVNQMLRPGPRVLLRLHPIIQYELKRVRERYRWFENFSLDSDNPPFPFDTFAEWLRDPSELWEERLKDRGTEET